MSEFCDIDEWLAELERLGIMEGEGCPEGCFSSEDLSRASGYGVTYVRQRIRDAILQGKAEVVKYRGKDMTGRPARLIAYRLVKESSVKRKR